MKDTIIDKFVKEFEAKALKDEAQTEFWHGRDLQKLLGYDEWRNFALVIDKAKEACKGSKHKASSHFVDVNKIVASGAASKPVDDVKLTRYACYLIAQNADSRKETVAFAQTYFAVQTRRQELRDQELSRLSEDEKRLALRQEIKTHNSRLSGVAKGAGVVLPLDYAIFQNAGYKGLYGGLDKKAIADRKGVAAKKDILDHMGSEELGANIFRITQTAAKIEREGVRGKQSANNTHFEVGKKVRQAIKEIGGVMPENLLSVENIKQITKKQKALLKKQKESE